MAVPQTTRDVQAASFRRNALYDASEASIGHQVVLLAPQRLSNQSNY
jgi:hypothetical protein